MDDSILISTKKVLNIPETDTSFDQDIVMFINTAFGVLDQLGIGPSGYSIDDEIAVWSDFIDPITSPNNAAQLNVVRTYIFLKVRMLFDPPNTSYHLSAMTDQLAEYEWRLVALKETP